MSYIELKNVTKEFKVGDSVITANKNISFNIEKGEFVIILGSSGAGKSTLLNILGGMDKNDSGDVIVDGNNISNCTKQQLTNYRRRDVGFIFQFYNLLPNLTARENVELAMEISNAKGDAKDFLKMVGLEHRIDNFPSHLSGGEQQRVSIARAVSKNPKLLLCDEPTGALDFNTGKQVLKILRDMSDKQGVTVIIVTHNSELAKIADKVIHMKDAKVVEILVNNDVKNVEEVEW